MGIFFNSKWLWFFPLNWSPHFPPLAAFLTFLFPVLNPRKHPSASHCPNFRPWKDRRQHYAARKKRIELRPLSLPPPPCLLSSALFIYKTFPASAVVWIDSATPQILLLFMPFHGLWLCGEIVLDQESPQLVHLLFFYFSCTLSVILIAPPKISNSEVLICLECLSLNSCFSLLKKVKSGTRCF